MITTGQENLPGKEIPMDRQARQSFRAAVPSPEGRIVLRAWFRDRADPAPRATAT
jgi:hypothetical protein